MRNVFCTAISCELFRNFYPVRRTYAVRERSSSDKERQRAGNAGCRAMSQRFVLDELKEKDLQDRMGLNSGLGSEAAGPDAVSRIEGRRAPAGMPALHVPKCRADKQERPTSLPRCRRCEAAWRGRRGRAWR